jgi:hypothetical protein
LVVLRVLVKAELMVVLKEIMLVGLSADKKAEMLVKMSVGYLVALLVVVMGLQ